MKFSVAVACLAVEAMARQPIVAERDLATIKGILDSVKTDLQNLDQAAKTATDDPEPLLKASNALIKSLKDGKSKADSSSDLTLTDAVGLTQPVQDLTKLGQTLADDFKALRPRVEKLGECDVVRTQISSISSGSDDLIKAVISKVPEAARDIANQLSAGLTKVLKQTQEDFSEQNCKSGGGGGGSPTSGSGSPTSAPAGSSSAPASTGGSAPSSSAAAPSSSAPVVTGTGGIPTPVPTSTGGSPPVVTAGAALFAPAGALAMAVAALVI
ncbi:hypothetical protein QQS21_012335 [Conoideocrella luteorostrata]|uniref:Cell wall protein n=1 Tax=Conoideocrella luteorostrata TaxID=1105319 RepID=A0AAJ0CBN3_9HYPO|nr:hypothetical protein QQS21_012335 [Conoideocrella luteorostrata]